MQDRYWLDLICYLRHAGAAPEDLIRYVRRIGDLYIRVAANKYRTDPLENVPRVEHPIR